MTTETFELCLTPHARRRARQRGLPDATLAALLRVADRAVPVGGGCVALSASRAGLAAECADGLSPEIAERLVGRVVVVCGSDHIVTALVARGAAGRRYGKRARNTARDRARARRR